MVEQYKKNLAEAVCQFKTWAKKNYPMVTEESDNGEWEICSPEFDHMCRRIVEFVKNVSCDEATERVIDDILYGIARDNECEYIIEELVELPQWYSLLCRSCPETKYTNAKWQFAKSLRDYKGSDNLQSIIYDYIDIGDEYTERMALMSLAYIYPERAEEYAIEFWNRDKYDYDEYQKIMVLHVLRKINSSKLFYYLELAEQSDLQYLRNNAKAIREEL